LLLTVALLSTLFGPIGAYWNATHVFNLGWLPHTRLSQLVGLFSMAGPFAAGVAQVERGVAIQDSLDMIASRDDDRHLKNGGSEWSERTISARVMLS
jgi:hypothetical protein